MSIPATDLLGWYARARRDLPWRAPGVTAWQILVSEFMLQQTPVARVAPIWVDWVDRWPTPSATAEAGAAAVLRAWGKLGYPRRAKRLHECAAVIAAEHGDVVPDDVETLLGLPGVGAYTARAIACFAYDKPVPVVDTNVRRVVARAVHGRADAGSPSTVRDNADVSALLPEDDSAPAFSAALMELGATVCTARSPKCGICPLPRCAWREAGWPAADGPGRPVQRYAGTDRQVRGKLLDVLRDCREPVERARLDVVWLTDTAQRDRALDSLLVDGLVEQTADGRFALAGEGDDARPQGVRRSRATPTPGDEARPQGVRRSRATPTPGDEARPQGVRRSRATPTPGDDARPQGVRRSRATPTPGDDARPQGV